MMHILLKKLQKIMLQKLYTIYGHNRLQGGELLEEH